MIFVASAMLAIWLMTYTKITIEYIGHYISRRLDILPDGLTVSVLSGFVIILVRSDYFN